MGCVCEMKRNRKRSEAPNTIRKSALGAVLIEKLMDFVRLSRGWGGGGGEGWVGGVKGFFKVCF